MLNAFFLYCVKLSDNHKSASFRINSLMSDIMYNVRHKKQDAEY